MKVSLHLTCNLRDLIGGVYVCMVFLIFFFCITRLLLPHMAFDPIHSLWVSFANITLTLKSTGTRSEK